MKTKNIVPPEGHKLFKMEIEEDCKNAAVYRSGRLKVPNKVVCLSKGEGRSCLVQYMVDMYKAHGVLGFDSGLDDYLDFTLDGSPQQLKKVKAQIESAAIYKNHYTGIVVVDPTEMAKHLYETQIKDLVSLIEEVSPHAVLVCFYPNRPNRAEMQLMDKLRKPLGDPWVIEYEEFEDEDELARITERYLSDRGICIEKPDKAHDYIVDFVGYQGFSHASEAIDFAKMLLMDVDYSKPAPTLDWRAIAMYTHDYDEEEEGKKVRE